ncbi:hypothetical protein ACKKBG_A19630 [Auxenochlorella protothecoides x Auxenochlorella symbiontica]
MCLTYRARAGVGLFPLPAVLATACMPAINPSAPQDGPALFPHVPRFPEYKAAVGTLDAVHHPHIGVDYTVSLEGITLSHTGRSSVFVSGYKTIASFMSDDDDDEHGGRGSSDDEDSEDFDSEDQDAPAGVPLRPRPAGTLESSDEERLGEGSDGDDSDLGSLLDEDDEEEEEEDDDDDDEEDDSEEDVPAPRASGKQVRARPEEQEAAPASAKKAKVAAAATPAPVSAKKVKTAATPAAAAPAPAAASPHSPSPAAVAEYVAALKAVLQAQGPQRVSALGALVKRPPQVPKLKSTVGANPAIFLHDLVTDIVSLVE